MRSVVIIHVIHDRTAHEATGTTEDAPGFRKLTQDAIRRSIVIHPCVGQATRGGIQPALAREIDADDTSPEPDWYR